MNYKLFIINFIVTLQMVRGQLKRLSEVQRQGGYPNYWSDSQGSMETYPRLRNPQKRRMEKYRDPGPPNIPVITLHHPEQPNCEELMWRLFLYLCALFALMLCWRYMLIDDVEELLFNGIESGARPVTDKLGDIV